MKKVLTLVAVVALAASFTACKKDHTCTCTESGVEIKTTVNSKKSVAMAMCEEEGYEIVKVEVGGVDVTSAATSGTSTNNCVLD